MFALPFSNDEGKVNSWANSAHSVHRDREHPTKNHTHTHMDGGNATCKTLPLISSNVFRSYYSIVCLSLFVFAFLLPRLLDECVWLVRDRASVCRGSCQNKRTHTRPANEMERRRTKANGIVCAHQKTKKLRRGQRFNIKGRFPHLLSMCWLSCVGLLNAHCVSIYNKQTDSYELWSFNFLLAVSHQLIFLKSMPTETRCGLKTRNTKKKWKMEKNNLPETSSLKWKINKKIIVNTTFVRHICRIPSLSLCILDGSGPLGRSGFVIFLFFFFFA